MAHALKAAGHFISHMAAAAYHAVASVTDDRVREAYLDQATDIIDLEMRMRELDKPNPPFAPYSITRFTRH